MMLRERQVLRITRLGALIVLSAVGARFSYAESLWTSGFQGYVSDRPSISVGDTILISLDEKVSLTFESSSSVSGQFAVELIGGEGAGLFSFLPDASSKGLRSLKGSDSLSLRSTVAARVVAVDEAGFAVIRASRSVSVEGRRQSIELSGAVGLSDVGRGTAVPFSRLVDARLVYRTLLESDSPVVEEADLALPSAVDAGEAVDGGLTEESRRRLLARYLDRALELILQRE